MVTKSDFRQLGEAARKFMPFVSEDGETYELVIGRCFQAESLWTTLDIRAAHELLLDAVKIAERVGDARARTIARSSLLFVRSFLGLDPVDAVERMKAELMDDCLRFGDNIIFNWCHFHIAVDYICRGLHIEAREVARRLIASGEERKDPRALGEASLLLSYIDMMCDDPVAATAHAEECIRVAVAPDERRQAAMVKAMSETLSGRAREGLEEIDALNSEFERSGALIEMQRGAQGAFLAMLGGVSEGIRMIEKDIARADATGDQFRAAWNRVLLSEIYIQILSSKEKPAAGVLFRNFWTIIGALIWLVAISSG